MVRNNNKTLLSGLALLHPTSASSAGGEEWGGTVSSLRAPVSLSSSSCFSPAPVWGHSHGIQSFINRLDVGPSHGLQFADTVVVTHGQ